MDVQACDMVVCFDHPATMKAFVQRRGRARRPDSIFAVLIQADEPTKYAKWAVLEEAMKEAYTLRNRRLQDVEEPEARSESEICSRSLCVESTGALLTFEGARQHLNHYCATLPRRTGRPECSPVYIVEGDREKLFSCKVILPSSLPPELQVIRSLGKWDTDTMVKKDTAFEACSRLYEAGLLNEHLLPPTVEKNRDVISKTHLNSFTEVSTAFNVWEYCKAAIKAKNQMYAHRIRILGSETDFPDLILLLPASLPWCRDRSLFESLNSTFVATVTLIGKVADLDHELVQRSTLFLFNSILARRLQSFCVGEDQLPYYLMPDLPLTSLEEWLNTAEMETPLEDAEIQQTMTYALKKKDEPTPYLYVNECQFPGSKINQATVQATRTSKKLDFSTTTQGAKSSIRELNVSECRVSNLPPGYFRVMAFIPTIMHQVELVLRAQGACLDTLRTIGFQDMRQLTSALTAPNASQRDNFQRLEYLGDALLKFYATVVLFCQNPGLPESQLTVLRDQVVKNERLQQRVVELGLDIYLSSEGFNPRTWSLKPSSDTHGVRKLSNKTLADVMEALIGAAFMDDCTSSSNESKLQRALTLFLPELQWSLPRDEISNMIIANFGELEDSRRLGQVEEMIGHRFQNRTLLREALTQSSIGSGGRSYERLEFLGDAVVDMIVKEALFRSKHNFSEGQMYARHITLVNKDILAFLATACSHQVEEKDITLNLQARKPVVETKWKRKCLLDYVVRVAVNEIYDPRIRFMKTYDQVKEVIAAEMKEGRAYPWSAMYQLDSPKWCSDIFESVIGAVFVDSGACIKTCERVLRKLGLMSFIERAAEEESVEFRQPLMRLREKFPALKVDLKKFRATSLLDDEDNRWGCRLRLGERVWTIVKGCNCPAEAESRAAEMALAQCGNAVLEEVEEPRKTPKRKRNEDADLKLGKRGGEP
jgi:dsRNA-specific ribonuclease